MIFKYCLVQYFAWLVDKRKRKKLFECKDCPIKSRCNKAERSEE